MNEWRLVPMSDGNYLIQKYYYGIWKYKGTAMSEADGRKQIENLKRPVIAI